MPANLVAIVIKAPPGAEFLCKAGNAYFDNGHGKAVERGVISYYAAQSLPSATTVESWLARIDALIEVDFRRHRLGRLERPPLQVLGNGRASLPGMAVLPAQD